MSTEFLNWIQQLIMGFSTAWNWLVTPLNLINVAPIYLIGFGGLLVFLGVAIVKWFFI